VGLVGIYLASRPKDEDHPYGHKKYETFFSLGIAFLLFLVAVGLVHESIGRFRSSTVPAIDIKSFIIMLATMATNFWVMRYERRNGTALKSDILVADSMHTGADMLVSLSVIVALVIIKAGYPVVDPIVALIIALFIAYTAFTITKHSSVILCDTAVIMDVKKIEDIVLAVKGVKSCHKIRTRGRPDDIYIDLHVQVSPNMPIKEAHKVSFAIEDAIKKGIPEITDVIVHVEPKH
jgi:cation diffusion facilitator family transporter